MEDTLPPATLTFRLPPELRARLEAEAHATGKSLAEITTEALTGWLDSGGFGARLTALEETVRLVMADTRQRDPGPLGLVTVNHLRKVTPDTRRAPCRGCELNAISAPYVSAPASAHDPDCPRVRQAPDTSGKVTERTRQPEPEGDGTWLTVGQAYKAAQLSGDAPPTIGTFRAQLAKGRLPEWERHPDHETLPKGSPYLRRRS